MECLKPCPFCGGAAEIVRDDPSIGFAFVECRDCAARGSISRESEAIEAWNTRAERTCKVERRDSAWGGYTEHCGACGADLGCDTRNTQNYCPRCGARVVG